MQIDVYVSISQENLFVGGIKLTGIGNFMIPRLLVR